MALAAGKQALRKQIGAVLRGIPAASLQEQDMPEFIKARNISIYLSMPSGELDTWMLCRSALRMGKNVYVPRFSTLNSGALASEHHKFTTDMQMLRIHDEHELDHGLTANKWGIAEPSELWGNSPREDREFLLTNIALLTGGQGLDIIIAPGMLFDTHGGRLGHGKGYYDRYIHRAHAFAQQKNRPAPFILALALREQVRDEPVPTDDTDWPIDALVSPDHQLRFSASNNIVSS